MKALKTMMIVMTMLVAASAMAQTEVRTVTLGESDPDFTVEARVVEVCRVTTTDINFGEYNADTGAANQEGTISVRCTKRTGTDLFRLSLGAVSGSLRSMTNTTNPSSAALEYTLTYDDAVNVGTGAEVPITVTASIAAEQWEAEAGSYVETVTASIVF